VLAATVVEGAAGVADVNVIITEAVINNCRLRNKRPSLPWPSLLIRQRLIGRWQTSFSNIFTTNK
jgi:hypothetical protein